MYPETTPTRDKELCSLSVSAGSPPLDSPMMVVLVFTSRTSNMFRGRRPDMVCWNCLPIMVYNAGHHDTTARAISQSISISYHQ